MTKPHDSSPLEVRNVQVATLRSEFLWVFCEDVPEAVQELLETDGSVEAVEEWAERWRLRADWLVEHAVERLGQMRRYGLATELWPDVFFTGLAAVQWLPKPVELVIKWQPDLPAGLDSKRWYAEELRTIPDHREPGVSWEVPERPRRLEVVIGGGSRETGKKHLAPILEEYFSAVTEEYRKAGFMRPIVYRGRHDGIPLELRLRALVWRCCGLPGRLPGRERPARRPPSWAELSLALKEHTGRRPNRSTLARSVRRLAELIDLPLP